MERAAALRAQRLQCNSGSGTIRLQNAAMSAENGSLHGHSHQPPSSTWAASTLLPCKGAQLQLTKRMHTICTSFSLTLSTKSRKSCPALPKHTGTELASFIGSIYQAGLILLVFVLPSHPQTLQHPCPVPRPGAQLCPSLAVY